MRNLAILFILPLLTSCTDAAYGKWQALGDPAYVECYSGERLIYSGQSTGKVSSEESSDGYYFVDAADGRPKEVSGNCVITYGEKPASAGLPAEM